MWNLEESHLALSVIIPTLNRPDAVRQTLEYLLQQEYPRDRWEIIVIDQSNVFDSHLLSRFPEVRHIRLEQKSLGLARNIGAHRAKGDILLFIDDDVRIEKKDFLLAHVRNYCDPTINVVAGKVLQPHDKPLYRLRSHRIGRITPRLLLVTGNFNWDQRQPVDGVVGCNFSVRRDVYLKVGGFDPNFIGTAHFEESEFCIRVRKAGYSIVFAPQAELQHLRWSSGGMREHANERVQAFYWFFHNHIYLFIKHGKRRYLPFLITYLLARGAAYILKYRDTRLFSDACLRGMRDGFQYARVKLRPAKVAGRDPDGLA